MRLEWVIAGVHGFFLSKDPTVDPSRAEGVCVTCNGVTYTYPGTLKPLGRTTWFTGEDVLGRYRGAVTKWDKCGFATTAKVYDPGNSGIHFEVMSQFFADDVKSTQLPNTTDEERMHGVLSCFPVLKVPPDPNVGFLQFKGTMAGKDAIIDNWINAGRRLRGGVNAGPLVLFLAEPKFAEMVAPLTNAMASNYVYTHQTLQFGILGSVTTIPKGFNIDFLAVGSEIGVQGAIATWGAYARLYHRKPAPASGDYTTDHLGYSTDNGAHYYYNTDHFANYEVLLGALKHYFYDSAIPIRHLLLDSWWYYQDATTQGVTNWTSRPDVFPNGLSYVRTLMKMPFIAHNRYWSAKTGYAKQNGGRYRFALDNSTQLAVPLDYVFWEDLLREARDWGVTVYEQDWLNVEYANVSALYQSATLGRTWLMQMGMAAANLGLQIQYCMAYPRHVISSLEVSAVTQVRATDDYQPQHWEWRQLGLTSALAHAVGVRPNKDSFYSSRSTVSAQYWPPVEIYNRLHAAISTLSQSTVAVSDALGHIDKALVMKSCRADGALLHPDAPAMLIDAAFYSRAKLFGTERTHNTSSVTKLRGEVWMTQSCYGSLCYKYIFAVPDAEYPMTLEEMHLAHDGTYFAFEHNATDTLIPVTASKALVLPRATALTFHLFTVMPSICNNKIVFLGDVSKWVPLSRKRFQDFEITEQRFAVTVKGMVDESVTVAWALVDTLHVTYEPVRILPSGTAYFVIDIQSGSEEDTGNVGHNGGQPVVIIEK